MNKNELKELIRTTDPDQAFLAELREALSEEMEKPADEQNYDRIDEITEAIAVITGTDHIIEEKSAAGIERMISELHRAQKKKHIRRICRRAAIACAVILVVSNVWSYSAYGMNVFSAAYKLYNGGMTVDLTKIGDPGSEAGDRFKQDMQDKCAEHQISAVMPDYIPAGFEPTENYGRFIETDHFSDIRFYFRKDIAKLIVHAREFDNPDEITPIGIPTDTHNISEQTINGTTVCVVKEDQEYRAVFLIDKTQYVITGINLDYDECQRILNSMF